MNTTAIANPNIRVTPAAINWIFGMILDYLAGTGTRGLSTTELSTKVTAAARRAIGCGQFATEAEVMTLNERPGQPYWEVSSATIASLLKKGGGVRGVVKGGTYGGRVYWMLQSEIDRVAAENEARALLGKRVRILNRLDWEQPCILVIVDDLCALTITTTVHTNLGTTRLLTDEFALAEAESFARKVRQALPTMQVAA